MVCFMPYICSYNFTFSSRYLCASSSTTFLLSLRSCSRALCFSLNAFLDSNYYEISFIFSFQKLIIFFKFCKKQLSDARYSSFLVLFSEHSFRIIFNLSFWRRLLQNSVITSSFFLRRSYNTLHFLPLFYYYCSWMFFFVNVYFILNS